MPLRRIAVLGGNDPAAAPAHLAAAEELGRLFAQQGITLLYAGDTEGPIAGLAASVSSANGRAVVLPIEELAERAEGFLALPGGHDELGALLDRCLQGPPSAELPCGLLNTASYFTDLLKQMADDLVERFVRETQRGRLIVQRNPAELLQAMEDFRPPETRRNTL